jgi:hypothetical protein
MLQRCKNAYRKGEQRLGPDLEVGSARAQRFDFLRLRQILLDNKIVLI